MILLLFDSPSRKEMGSSLSALIRRTSIPRVMVEWEMPERTSGHGVLRGHAEPHVVFFEQACA